MSGLEKMLFNHQGTKVYKESTITDIKIGNYFRKLPGPPFPVAEKSQLQNIAIRPNFGNPKRALATRKMAGTPCFWGL